MARIEAATLIEADPDRVWAVLVDWEGQPRWMRDARSVTVLSPHREGLDVVVRCMTRIAPGCTLTDDLVTTEWDEPRVLGMRHLGWLIRGVGSFELEPVPQGTRVVWWEELELPLASLGDAVAGVAVVPVVTRVFRASLADLKRLCESSGVSP